MKNFIIKATGGKGVAHFGETPCIVHPLYTIATVQVNSTQRILFGDGHINVKTDGVIKPPSGYIVRRQFNFQNYERSSTGRENPAIKLLLIIIITYYYIGTVFDPSARPRDSYIYMCV